ncbi:pleckstrin domain-containing protein [Cavenderia fasciculata]|uniref:Pleckstrin domain-containing protein n=1 Tax=Cavenderia fasciculata TaxID=261658 RepID=F4QBT3_CACFS|nr:pleckstrin domain-containing protein [Cavenderia fasciculata]EGG14671.1 pleckstrin domain-containing protein [Cavenderia fasciculata]|eukprot:XP_004351179.1 pleckstrin domain-containing protein [Cavenderia fasciculata]
MSKSCGSCAKVNAVTARFCVSCGNSLGTTTSSSSPAKTATTTAGGPAKTATTTTSPAKTTTTTASPAKTTGTTVTSKSTLKLAPVISSTASTSSSGANGAASKPLPTPPPTTGSSSTTTTTTAPLVSSGSGGRGSTLRINKTTPPTTTTTTTTTPVTSTSRSFSVSYKTPPSLGSSGTTTTTTSTSAAPTIPNRGGTLRPAPKPPVTTTTTPSTTTTTTTPSESFLAVKLKETKIDGAGANGGNRPKSHTISSASVDSKPMVTPGGSFVKNAIKSRDTLDHKVQSEVKVINGDMHAPVVKPMPTPPTTNGHSVHVTSPKSLTMGAQKDRDHTVIHKKSVSAPPAPPPPTSHHSSSSSSSSSSLAPPELPKKPAHLKTQNSMDNLQKLEKEKFDRSQAEREKQDMEKQRLDRERDERDREKLRLIEKERKEKVERERLKMQHEKEERDKEKIAEKERAKAERQLQKEKDREEKGVKAKQDKEEREKEKLRKQQEKERKLQEREEVANERERSDSISIRLSGSNNSIDTAITNSNSHSSSSLNHSNVSDDEDIPSSPKLTFSDVRNKDLEKKKKEREKYNTSPAHGRSRFFSFILGDKDKEYNPSSDEFVISSPSLQNSGGGDRPSTPVTFAAGDEAHASGDECDSSQGGGPQLRKWAIKRNEHQKSEKDLLASSASMAPSSPSQQSVLIATNRISQIYEENGSPAGGSSPATVSISHSNSPSQSSFVLGSSRLSVPQPPPDLPALPPATDQRSRVVSEFIVTEADYIRDLEIMVWLRKELVHQDEQSKNSSIDEINALFSNVEQLIMVNKMLYSEFCKPPPDTNDFGEAIAIALASMSEFLKSYFVYCSNQTKALSTFTNLRGKNCSYLGYLLSRRECRSLPFDSFLIKPIQRACKYPLLIRELLKSTPENHKSYSMLKVAQTKIESIVATINEKKREFDGQMRMYEIQSRFVESDIEMEKTILAPSRKLAKEGVIDSMGYFIPGNTSTQYYKKAKEGCYFLFNDLLIWGTPNKSGGIMTDVPSATDPNCPLKLRAYIPLDSCIIRDVPTDPNAFEIIYSNKEVWMFILDDEETRISLYNEIDQLIETNLKNEYKKFVEQKEKEDLENQKNNANNNTKDNNNKDQPLVVETYEDWKLLVRNKPLPEVPKLPSLPPLPDLASSSSSLSTE